LQEIGAVLLHSFHGQCSELIQAAQHSASSLVLLVSSFFPGFRDSAVYSLPPSSARQVFFYKRAQIFVGDLWGAFQGQGLGFFHDIHKLTCFADYRVPQLLRSLGMHAALVSLNHLSFRLFFASFFLL
jgi:hypothetical protein